MGCIGSSLVRAFGGFMGPGGAVLGVSCWPEGVSWKIFGAGPSIFGLQVAAEYVVAGAWFVRVKASAVKRWGFICPFQSAC